MKKNIIISVVVLLLIAGAAYVVADYQTYNQDKKVAAATAAAKKSSTESELRNLNVSLSTAAQTNDAKRVTVCNEYAKTINAYKLKVVLPAECK